MENQTKVFTRKETNITNGKYAFFFVTFLLIDLLIFLFIHLEGFVEIIESLKIWGYIQISYFLVGGTLGVIIGELYRKNNCLLDVPPLEITDDYIFINDLNPNKPKKILIKDVQTFAYSPSFEFHFKTKPHLCSQNCGTIYFLAKGKRYSVSNVDNLESTCKTLDELFAKVSPQYVKDNKLNFEEKSDLSNKQ